MPLRRRVSKDVMERYAADEELAAAHQDRVTAAVRAEQALRRAQAEGGHSDAELRGLFSELDDALLAAITSAEAAERVAMGPKTYGSDDAKEARAAEIARRRAKAKPAVRPWTDEVDRLRTAREINKLSYRAVDRV
jgi:hypothetical protein